MKIAVFIDFSEGSKIALVQAFKLTKLTGGKVIAINIIDQDAKRNETQQKLSAFVEAVNSEKQIVEYGIGIGDLFVESKRILISFEPDYVFICTHGVKGLKQTLFGAFIVKLVQSVPYSSIVFQENNKVDLSEPKNVLFPVGVHKQFETKIKEAIKFAHLTSSKMIIYYIDKPSLGEEADKLANMKSAVSRFEAENIPFEVVREDLMVFSAGYSKQTLSYCDTHPVHLITLMASVSAQDDFMNEADKEQFLVNELGIPVFCCNA